MDNIIETIHFGLRKGFNQLKQFENSFSGIENQMTEYLLTVFVGIELNAFPFPIRHAKVKLEYPLWQFYTKAFPSVKWNMENIFETSYIKREYKKKRTKQRIDIVILGQDNQDNERSYHAIELKAINTNNTGIINDLQRLSDSMITHDISDQNSIQSCYFGCIKAYKDDFKPINKDELERIRNEKVQEVESLINTNYKQEQKYSSLEYTVHHKDIDSVSTEDFLKSYEGIRDEFGEQVTPDYSDAVSETGEVLGIVIEIKRKSDSNG